MEALESCLFLDQVPQNWTKRAYPSMLTLGPWFADLLLRLKELEAWTSDFNVRIYVCKYLGMLKNGVFWDVTLYFFVACVGC
jgi:hypothetical protein